MALWLPSNNKVYLPPTSVSKVVTTDSYVTRTPYFYYAGSSRLLTVGHPYFNIPGGENGQDKVPKVSAYQYRVFRIKLPDPNRFGLPDASVFDPDKERLVWGCIGVEVGRGQPLGIGTSGHPLLNRNEDSENSSKYNPNGAKAVDNRQNISLDNKQTQLFILGCHPPLGEHWAQALTCDSVRVQPGDCPPLELVNSIIEDGDMVDTGFGALDFKTLNADKSSVPLDITNSICKYPDYLKMAADQHGNSLFFFLRREQMFTRHLFNKAGNTGDEIPAALYFKATGGQNQETLGSSTYYGTPSGSLVSTDAQIFNRPYWIHKAQGHNNGICWENQLFLTVVDTTRSTNFTVSVESEKEDTYKATNFKQYLRHVEEYDLQFIFQLCKVSLTAEVMAYLHTMDPDILETWNLGLNPPPSSSLEDTYRYIQSAATRCPDKVPPKERVDHYGKFKFWNLDLTAKFSSDLDQFPLGRKFLLQNAKASFKRTLKRPAPTSTKRSIKKKRTL